MELTFDLYVTMTLRIAVLFACGGYLFYKWVKAPRHYTFDLPFLMGVSFAAFAVSKIFDLLLYQMFYGEEMVHQYDVGRPDLYLGHLRWLLMLVVLAPLLYANLRVWVAERERARLAAVGAYVAIYAILILQTNTFAGLNFLLPFIVFPAAAINIITFLFAYVRKRLPNVHGLLVGLGWAAYVVSSSVRPTLMHIGEGTFGLLSVAEVLDMLAWMVIFAGLTLRPKYARAVFSPMPKLSAASPAPA